MVEVDCGAGIPVSRVPTENYLDRYPGSNRIKINDSDTSGPTERFEDAWTCRGHSDRTKVMSNRKGQSNQKRFPRRKDSAGRTLCRFCSHRTMSNRHTFCGPRCLRDFFMQTDWERVRKVVYVRDGGICMKCGRRVNSRSFHVDHIVPLVHGGDEWSLDNLELACRECNLQKGSRLELEYVVLMPEKE